MKLPSLVFLALLLCGAAPGAVSAAPLSGEPARRIRHWGREDGLPQASVSAITQTPDGYLWFVTFSGLVRFDGRRFTLLEDAESRANDLGNSALAVTREGELVMSNLYGEVYAQREGQLVRLARFPDKIFERAAQDDAGDLWLLDAQRTLFRVRDRRTIVLEKNPDTAWCVPALVAETGGTRVWTLRDRELGTLKGGQYTAVRSGAGDFVRGLGLARTRGIWLVFADRLERWVDGQLAQTIQTGAWIGSDEVTAVTETSDGAVAVGTTTHGLHIFDQGGKETRFDRTNGLASEWISCLFVDHEGTLWVGPANQGLQSIQRVTFAPLPASEKWNGRSVTRLLVDANDVLWSGSEGGGLYRRNGTQWEPVPLTHPSANGYVWSMEFDAEQSLWVGTWGAGVYQRVGEEFVAHPEIAAPYQGPPVFLKARDGSFWIGSEQGVFHRTKDGMVTYGAEQGVPRAMIIRLREGADGAIWFGTNGQGLGCVRDGKVRIYREADGLFGEHVNGLSFDENGALWIGTEKGLTRLQDGKFRHLGPADGLRATYIGELLDDGHGFWWLPTRDGMLRVEKDVLRRRMDGADVPLPMRLFTTEDGLPTIECSGNAVLMADGTLLVPTKGGIAFTNPANVITNQQVPPVRVESLTVDGGPLQPNLGTPAVIAPGAQRYTFAFTAPTYVAAANAAFRYKLEGVDKAWVNADPERTASYSFLPPGTYVFSVLGSNGHGVWNPEPARMTLTVLPAFWQTWWFRALAYLTGVALLGLLIIGIARRRWAAELAVLERRQALERERARIAQDIHDDVGASLTRLSLLTQSAQRGMVSAPGEVAQHLDQIGRTTREMTRTMDEIVWAVNPSHDSLDGIATYVAAYAQDFLGTAGISCRWNFPLTLPAWPVSAEVRHNLFLAIKEALANVVHHAHATRVDLVLEVAPDGFAITVTDDGKGGVPPESDHPTRASGGGNGLRNMRLRLAEIGGRCTITSEPGRGTSVRFSITLPPGVAGQSSLSS